MHSKQFLKRFAELCLTRDFAGKIELMARLIHKAQRVFVIGLGGSAANASHAVNDLRKLCQIEAHCPTDNVAEFSARINDDPITDIFVGWMRVLNFNWRDCLLVFSVGGGTNSVSVPITEAVLEAARIKAPIIGVVGSLGGIAFQKGDCVIRIPEKHSPTPYTEAMQMVVLHCLVSHPLLQKAKTKW